MKKILALFILLLVVGAAAAQSRTVLSAPLTLYVNCASGSDANSGTAAQPFATPARAYNYAQEKIDLAGYTITTQLQGDCAGVQTYLSGPLVGARGPKSFIFQGTVDQKPMAVSITHSGQVFLWHAEYGAQFTLQWMRLSAPNGNAVTAGGDAVIRLGYIYWDAAAHSHINAAGPRAFVETFGWSYILGGGNTNIHAVAEDHALITFRQHIYVSACPAVATAFVQADLGGIIDATGFTWSEGCLQGRRFNAISNGIVFTGLPAGQAPANFFPGTTAGESNTGGYYQ